jgi:enamine deaminase RidA (YjgF/YER057c/UK114 family)
MRGLLLLWAGLAGAGDLIYLSGIHTARGNAAQQTREVLNRLNAELKRSGLDARHVVSTNVYVTDLRLLPEVDAVYERYFAKSPPARTVLEAGLLTPGAVVEISAVAVRDLATRRAAASGAVLAGDTLFLPGLRPGDPNSPVQAQTEQVMRQQESILASAGFTFADLVFSRIYLADPATYNGLNEAYRKFVTAPPPARATVNGHPVEPGHLLQIQSVAVKGSGVGRPSGEGHTSPIHSYSVKAGGRLYVTGMTGRAPDGRFARNDIQAQTRQSLLTIDEQLRRHGMTFADVADSVVWLRDLRHYEGMHAVYGETIKARHARTVVRIPPSSGEALVEIMVTAEHSRK